MCSMALPIFSTRESRIACRHLLLRTIISTKKKKKLLDPLDFQYGKEKGLTLPIFSIIKKTAFSPPIFSSENKKKAFSQE